MGKTSAAVKNRYNKKAYRDFRTAVKPDLFDAITDYCTAHELSRPQFLAKAMEILSGQDKKEHSGENPTD